MLRVLLANSLGLIHETYNRNDKRTLTQSDDSELSELTDKLTEAEAELSHRTRGLGQGCQPKLDF